MKYRKNIAGFAKGKAVNYSTSVTATKGEQILIWLEVLLFFAILALVIFVFQNFFAMILTIFLGIFIIMGTVVLCVFRKSHKEERQRNTKIVKEDVNDFYVNLPGIQNKKLGNTEQR